MIVCRMDLLFELSRVMAIIDYPLAIYKELDGAREYSYTSHIYENEFYKDTLVLPRYM